MKQAVILAAGLGSRLASQLEDRPKGFLRLGQSSIVEESIARLTAAGIEEVVIVTGHLARYYEQLARESGGIVMTVFNPRYAESGSMYSLWCARERIRSGFLLLESDLVYEQRALELLVQSDHEDALLISGATGAGDEVYVACRDGCLAGMSKDPATLPGPPAGELVGISRLSGSLFERMCRIAEAEFASSLKFDYEIDCMVAAGRETDIHCIYDEHLLWGEIDDPVHLSRVRDSVYPAILRSGA